MKPINPNSTFYFMGFNAFQRPGSTNPFNRNTQRKAAMDWLRGFVAAQLKSQLKAA